MAERHRRTASGGDLVTAAADRGGPAASAQTRALLARVGSYGLLALMAVIALYPLYLVIANSLKSNTGVALNPSGFPAPPTLSSYSQLVAAGELHSFLNSLIVASSTTVGAVFISALAGYAFTKLRFPGRAIIFACLIATIMVPIQTAIPGFYVEFAKLHWLNTYQVQIVPFLAPVFGLFMVRQYLLSVPDEIIEAARMDGAGEWSIYWRIIVPLLRPVLAALGVLEFLMMWNSFVWPQVMADTSNVAPLPVTLPTLTDRTLGIVPLYGEIMAGSVLAIVPLIIVFLRYQRAFVSGVTYGNT
jgi:ABC-type glycerol-3-phosphate transport system permease component